LWYSYYLYPSLGNCNKQLIFIDLFELLIRLRSMHLVAARPLPHAPAKKEENILLTHMVCLQRKSLQCCLSIVASVLRRGEKRELLFIDAINKHK